MATLALGAIGTLIGGPIGGAIGALAGRQIDMALIGSETREGPRLDDLTITTSSYGTPLAKHYGRMRTAGTIIWATDLQENRETSGGGKGKPKIASFSYSTSFAVALSSRPITRLGRIWADGNLLRGAAGDLKVGGALRIYDGYGDQPADPIISAVEGEACPAFRGRAYVVFEDLQLEDFGNRIPALSFEVFADDHELALSDIVDPLADDTSAPVALSELAGFSYKGGSLVRIIDTISSLYPTYADSDASGTTIRSAAAYDSQPRELPEPMPAWLDEDFGSDDGTSLHRSAQSAASPSAMRYYDTSRDYQTGVQRPDGRANWTGNQVVEFPGALTPDDARSLINHAARRVQGASESLRWRVAELDQRFSPGTLVSAPDMLGIWIITAWEWRERGVELDLERPPARRGSASPGDQGAPALPPDSLPFPTWLRAFELPWDGIGSSDESQIYAALGAESPNWTGAALYSEGYSEGYSENGGPLSPIGASGRRQATMGKLTSALPAATALLFDPTGFIEVATVSASMSFDPTDLAGLANGQNRLLVGDEIIQFVSAEPTAPNLWRLAGLLRGRGGSELAAAQGHNAETLVTLIDDRVVALDSAQIPLGPTSTIAAIGRGDDEPVLAEISNRGAGLRPLSPVHPAALNGSNATLELCWTRRARGAWTWIDGVGTPLIEAAETYRVGIGDIEDPDAIWEVHEPTIMLTAPQIAEYSGSAVWVMQAGRVSYSDPTLLTILP